MSHTNTNTSSIPKAGWQTVANLIQKINQQVDPNLLNPSFPATTLDFTTLYTKLPQKVLCRELKHLIDALFFHKRAHFAPTKRKSNSKSPNKQLYIKINLDTYTASWIRADTQPTNTDSIAYASNTDLADWITTLVSNIYVKVGGTYYKQIIGIPMGTNCAVYLANLLLFSYDSPLSKTALKTKNGKQSNSAPTLVDSSTT